MEENDAPIKVTSENLGALLIAGMEEVLAFERGEATARVVTRDAVSGERTEYPAITAPALRARTEGRCAR